MSFVYVFLCYSCPLSYSCFVSELVECLEKHVSEEIDFIFSSSFVMKFFDTSLIGEVF